MPSTSKAQSRTMRAIAHGWKPPKGSGIKIPVKVAKEFSDADAGTKIARGRGKAAPRMKGTGKGLMGR